MQVTEQSQYHYAVHYLSVKLEINQQQNKTRTKSKICWTTTVFGNEPVHPNSCLCPWMDDLRKQLWLKVFHFQLTELPLWLSSLSNDANLATNSTCIYQVSSLSPVPHVISILKLTNSVWFLTRHKFKGHSFVTDYKVTEIRRNMSRPQMSSLVKQYKDSLTEEGEFVC